MLDWVKSLAQKRKRIIYIYIYIKDTHRRNPKINFEWLES